VAARDTFLSCSWPVRHMRGGKMIGRNIKKTNLSLWLVGQLASAFAGLLIGIEHGFSVGFTVFFALCVLVDIRGQI